MNVKKMVCLVLVGVLALLTMFGCGGGNNTSSTSPASTASKDETPAATSSDATLTIWLYGWEAASATAVKEDAVKWEEQTGVHIECVDVASDSYNTKIQATLAGDEAPDLAFIDAGVLTTQLASKGKLVGLNQYGVEQYKDKFYDSVWDTLVWKDDVYGLRITSNNLALFYNKDLFANAGVAEPTADWTWDDLRDAAKKLTNEEEGIYGLDLPIYSESGGYCWNWLPFLWQNGGDFLNADRTQAVFNSAKGVEALEFWKAMAQEDGSIPLAGAPSGVNRFSSGLTAMVIDGPWMLNPYLADPEFKDVFNVAPLPKKERQATVVGGEGVVIFSETSYPQEAYDYLVHLCCSEFAQTFWENWITIPPQPEFADFYADNEMGPYLQVFSDQMAYSETRPFTPTWPQIENVMGTSLQGYMFDQTDDAQAALDEAARQVDELLAEEG